MLKIFKFEMLQRVMRHPYSLLAPVPHVKHDVKDIDPAKETVTA